MAYSQILAWKDKHKDNHSMAVAIAYPTETAAWDASAACVAFAASVACAAFVASAASAAWLLAVLAKCHPKYQHLQ